MEGLRISFRAAGESSLTVMFEPSGMTYDLGPNESVHATVVDRDGGDEIRIEQWNGGISVWPPGNVITSDADGNELHRLP